jgi:predicted  nucleic acid-binding Zn-ribbon protein
MNKASVTKPAEDSTTDLVHHLALEVRTIGSKLDDLVGFFPAAVKMMQSKVEAVERENEELKKSLVRAEENYESLEKQVKEMSALIKAQKKA